MESLPEQKYAEIMFIIMLLDSAVTKLYTNYLFPLMCRETPDFDLVDVKQMHPVAR